MDRRVQAADEQNVNVPRTFFRHWRSVLLSEAKQVCGTSAYEALAPERLDTGRVCQDHVTVAKAATVSVELQVPVRSQTDQRDRGRPKPRWHRRVCQIQSYEVRLPACGKPILKC